jgi:hypothetical protein
MSYEQPGEQESPQSAPLEGILIAHVVCGAAATLVLLPFGVLIPRYARALSTGQWWFTLHMAVQIIGIILALIALATGFAQGGAEGAAHPVSLLQRLQRLMLLGIGSRARDRSWTPSPTWSLHSLVQGKITPCCRQVRKRIPTLRAYRSRFDRHYRRVGHGYNRFVLFLQLQKGSADHQASCRNGREIMPLGRECSSWAGRSFLEF